MQASGSPRFDWRRMVPARRGAAKKSGQTLVLVGGGVVLVLFVFWFLLSDGDDDKKSAKSGSTASSTSTSVSGTQGSSPTSTARLQVTARQSIGLEIRERPGAGKTLTELTEGTRVVATCTVKGPNVYGWRGGKSDQWVRVTTSKGAGYAPEAWLETSGSTRDLLPTC